MQSFHLAFGAINMSQNGCQYEKLLKTTMVVLIYTGKSGK
jgi:hypothetical protein